MKNESDGQWQSLCEQAAKEQDPDRLMALVRDIIKLLDEQRKSKTPETAA